MKIKEKHTIILTLDTSSNTEASVLLEIDNDKYKLTKIYDKNKSQIILPLIQELLKKHNITLQDINEINVNGGPGSFTGLRVGASIANALGYYLQIPINGKKRGVLVEPKYT